jgi:hypothetical protein
MLIRNRRAFVSGMVLTISFTCVLLLLFAPVFGDGRNGLQYADDMFNRLSKGSSYFLPKVAQHADAIAGKGFRLELPFQSDDAAALAAAQFRAAGLTVEGVGRELRVAGDLGGMLGAVLRDAEDGYRNDDEALRQRYGVPGRAALANWWQLMNRLDNSLKLDKRLPEARAVAEVMKKGVEPAHNYYGIEAEKVTDMIPQILGLLVFYVIYTVWWGYAILRLMEGMGLALRCH